MTQVFSKILIQSTNGFRVSTALTGIKTNNVAAGREAAAVTVTVTYTVVGDSMGPVGVAATLAGAVGIAR